ncbi:MAG TPA: ATP-binding protein, partial [Candidatus Melainabacteria bacterium]|nr:ATP-binding protein [Candidatus Melainabacteria bacterium]
LVNLVSNAVKFSEPGTAITLWASISEDDPENIRFSVIDQGRGIPETHINKVFEKFQQVEASDASIKGGKGLGLSICKSIVEAHGGHIGVESVSGQGSTFWFTVPRT